MFKSQFKVSEVCAYKIRTSIKFKIKVLLFYLFGWLVGWLTRKENPALDEISFLLTLQHFDFRDSLHDSRKCIVWNTRPIKLSPDILFTIFGKKLLFYVVDFHKNICKYFVSDFFFIIETFYLLEIEQNIAFWRIMYSTD